MATVFMLSGQGTQYYQMARDLYEEDPDFRRHLDALDEMTHDLVRLSVLREIHAAEKGYSCPMRETLLSSLAICLIELAILKTLQGRGVEPSMFLGTSFGTFVASVAVGHIGEKESIGCFVEHSQLFEVNCEPGGMIAVLASPETYHGSPLLRENAELAAVNYGNNYVLSFPEAHRSAVEGALEPMQVMRQTMPVTRAYHSRWIESARDAFFRLYGNLAETVPAIPLVCASTTRALPVLNAQVLWGVVRRGILFEQTVQALEARGPHDYIDLGPSGTLATFTKYCLPTGSASRVFPIITPFRRSKQRLDEVVARVASPAKAARD
jgi:bacillaene synthase trans-acting acyltransferase